MERTIIRSIYREEDRFLNQEIKVKAWVRTLRSSNAVGFIELNDGTFFKNLQAVFDGSLANFQEISEVTIGSALEIDGRLIASPAAGQKFELQASSIKVLSLAAADYPLQKKRHSFEFLRTIAHLRGRSNTFSAVFRVRSVLSYAIHRFFQERGFVYAHTPIISSSDCEGAGEMFHVTSLDLATAPKKGDGQVDFSKDFFGTETGLTVSGQLQGEAMSLAFQNIYTFGPTFRAENSNTTKHAAEFWMIEPEIAFANLVNDMNLAEEMIKYLINYLKQECPEELEFFNKFVDQELLARLDHITGSVFERVPYSEAVELLKKSGHKFEYPVDWGTDLQTEHERYLTENIFKKPVFVTDYPKDFKAFYMRLNDDGRTVAATDLLVPGIGEIIGGSQREERLEVLEERMKKAGLKTEDYWWYLELRKYGGVEHAGFGLGFERLIMYVTGMGNIRDVIPFPRTPKNAQF